jgi:hypothetical protein
MWNFPDGFRTPSVGRIGAIVGRLGEHWTLAVHALRKHLNAAGFKRAPRPIRIDIVTGTEGKLSNEAYYKVGFVRKRCPALRLLSYSIVSRILEVVFSVAAYAEMDWDIFCFCITDCKFSNQFPRFLR